mmetsp:Transcript_21729/g.53661  ORF Transcript_21729/g.53661 Transcript_21729/m.53661 type:complete len:82 (-) Transcript_21729:194-439(-)
MDVADAVSMLTYLHKHGFHEIWELHHEEENTYRENIKETRIDTLATDWAQIFTDKIYNCGDMRGACFTDLSLKLSENDSLG